MANNKKLVDHQSYHIPVQYIQGRQSVSVNGSRSPNDSKYKLDDNNSLLVKLRENKNSSNKENRGVVKSISKKEIMIVGDSTIKHVNGNEVSRDDSVKIRCHPGVTTDDIIDYVRPAACKKPDMIIIHVRTNNIQIKCTRFKKLERSILPLKKLMLTMKYKLLSQVSSTVMIKTLRKKLKKSTESWRIYVRVKGLSSLIITILMVHALIEANYT